MRNLTSRILIALLLLGTARATWLVSNLYDLKAERQSLEQIVGVFPSASQDDLQVIHVANQDPLHFEWRVQINPRSSIFPSMYCANGSANSLLPYKKPAGGVLYNESVGRIFRQSIYFEFVDKHLLVHTNGIVGSRTQMPLSESACQFLSSHWQKLDFQISPKPVAQIPPGKKHDLIKVTIPDKLLNDLKRLLNQDEFRQLAQNPLFRFEIQNIAAASP